MFWRLLGWFWMYPKLLLTCWNKTKAMNHQTRTEVPEASWVRAMSGQKSHHYFFRGVTAAGLSSHRSRPWVHFHSCFCPRTETNKRPSCNTIHVGTKLPHYFFRVLNSNRSKAWACPRAMSTTRQPSRRTIHVGTKIPHYFFRGVAGLVGWAELKQI